MAVFIFLLIFVIILAVLVLRWKPFDHSTLHGSARWLFYIALALIVLYIGFWLTFAIGEMTGGDISGIGHLPPALALALMLWFAWRRPFETGVGLMILGVVASGFFLIAGLDRGSEVITSVFFGGILFFIPGLLLWLATRSSVKAQ